MGSSPEVNPSAEIGRVRETWLAAVRASDAEAIAALVTEDVVVVHGDGGCLRGREQLKADFLRAFQAVAIAQTVLSLQVTVPCDWAFEISEVESTLTPLHGGEPTHALTTTVVALRRQAAGD
jgi:uncharacterized protein (TIGR02246 family)